MLVNQLCKMDRKGSVAVEFALISILLLVPLFLGSADFIVILSAQAQLNTTMQAIDYFAFTDPADADTASNSYKYAQDIVTLINQKSLYAVTMPTTLTANLGTSSLSGSNGMVIYGCYTALTTSSTTTSITYQQSACTGTNTTQQEWVAYKVQTSLTLPIPLPYFPNPFVLSASGTVEVQ